MNYTLLTIALLFLCHLCVSARELFPATASINKPADDQIEQY